MTLSQRAEAVKLRRLADDPIGWMNDGACRHPDIPTDLFFAEEGQAHIYWPARLICHTCPVKAVCLEYALRHHIDHGVWGGMSPKERRAETKRRRHAA